jgi:hypothetical protein
MSAATIAARHTNSGVASRPENSRLPWNPLVTAAGSRASARGEEVQVDPEQEDRDRRERGPWERHQTKKNVKPRTA